MNDFYIFESAFRKATLNHDGTKDAVSYALKKYVVHLLESLKLYADEETQECFIDEAFEIYCEQRRDDNTHGEAARAATKHIQHTLKEADGKRGSSRGKTYTPSSPRDKPLYYYENMHDSLPGSTRRFSYKKDHTSFRARGKPVYNYADPRDDPNYSSTRGKPVYDYEDMYQSLPKCSRASERQSCKKDTSSEFREDSLYDSEDMFDALPKSSRDSEHCRKDRGHNCGHSPTSHFHGGHSHDGHSYTPRPHSGHSQGGQSYRDHSRSDHYSDPHCHNHEDSHHGYSSRDFYGAHSFAEESGRPFPPMPAGTGRFKFPEPIFTDARGGFPGGRWSFSTHEFRPSDHGSYSTREFRTSKGGQNTREFRPSEGGHGHSTHEFRSSEGGHNTREFKPSWYSSDTPRASEYGYDYSDSSSPPPRFHKTFRPSSSHRRPPNPPSAGIKPPTCFYTVLNISRTASPHDIKTAYRKMSMKHHPDRAAGADKAKATAKMAEINQANDVLSNPVKRRFYDRTGCVPGVLDA